MPADSEGIDWTAAGEAWGVIQQKFNLATSGFATDLNRQATVATSGLLLVQADGANMQAQNDALKVDATGKSSSAGGAVTQNQRRKDEQARSSGNKSSRHNTPRNATPIIALTRPAWKQRDIR